MPSYHQIAHKRGYSDGVFKRPMNNPHKPYTHSWHAYNVGYFDGRLKAIDTTALHKKEE